MEDEFDGDEYDHYESPEQIMSLDAYHDLLRELKCSDNYIDMKIKTILNGRDYNPYIMLSVDGPFVELLD